MIQTLSVQTGGQGLYDITRQVEAVVGDTGIDSGLCTVFLQHTSASLIIQENADPAVQHDLQRWLARLVSEHDPLIPIPMKARTTCRHIKTALTASSLVIPCINGRLALGTWQGFMSGNTVPMVDSVASSSTLVPESPN